MKLTEAYKGIPPGTIILHSLKTKGLSQKDLAFQVGVPAQTISAIVRGTRAIPENLCFKLDDALHFEPGFFCIIQAFYKVKVHTEATNTAIGKPHPHIRPVVFWDIRMETLDWNRNKSFIIRRVMERGSLREIEEVQRFYGE